MNNMNRYELEDLILKEIREKISYEKD